MRCALALCPFQPPYLPSRVRERVCLDAQTSARPAAFTRRCRTMATGPNAGAFSAMARPLKLTRPARVHLRPRQAAAPPNIRPMPGGVLAQMFASIATTLEPSRGKKRPRWSMGTYPDPPRRRRDNILVWHPRLAFASLIRQPSLAATPSCMVGATQSPPAA